MRVPILFKALNIPNRKQEDKQPVSLKNFQEDQDKVSENALKIVFRT
jgi:hypothetical protein